MSEENIAFRLKFLIENLGISSSQFADKCDIARPTLSQLLTGRNKKISNLIIEQIHAAYPDLSILWLLFGEGEMWSGSMVKKSTVDEAPDEDKAQTECENPCENMEIPSSGRDAQREAKENGVKSCENTTKISNFEQLDTTQKSSEILDKIEILREKSRKVVQVTIYYDDSTFQTFYPKE